QTEGLQKPPAGLSFPLAGNRRSLTTMNHIAASPAPRQQTGMTILIDQDHRDVVLCRRKHLHDLAGCHGPPGFADHVHALGL
ncbi:MAG: hypothetical protein RLZZ58_236, partial [Pseudomonadota bacterium]